MVAKGLVGADETEAAVPVPTPQSTKATKKPNFLKPPEGMDVDFESPSTAAIVTSHMDWNVDVDLGNTLESLNGDGEED